MHTSTTAFAIFGLLFWPSSPLSAQASEDSAQAVVRDAQMGLSTRDTALVARAFLPTANLIVLTTLGDSTVLRAIPIAAIRASLATPGPSRREVLRNVHVEIVADLATVTGDYTFYYDATLHHCGTAVYDLVRAHGQWRIAEIRQTDRRTGCPDSPPN